MIDFNELESDDDNIKKELEMLQVLNPIFLRIEELPEDYEMEISKVNLLNLKC